MFQAITQYPQPQNKRLPMRLDSGYGLRGYLKGLSLSLKCPFPTRMEYFTFRATFQLQDTAVLQSSDANKDNLRILFHPGRSVSHAACVSGLWSASFGRDAARGSDQRTVDPSGENDASASNFLNWVNENAVQIEADGVPVGTHNIVNTDVQVEAIGMPTQLLSNSVRVLGGICNLRIQSGTTVRGHIAHMCLSNEENKAAARTLATQMRTNTNIGRKYLEPGVHDYTFHAPLQNKSAISMFGPVEPKFNWDDNDPFCGLLLTFNDITFSTVDAPPLVTFSYIVPMQVQLDQSVRHFATKEANTTIDSIEDRHSKHQGHVGKNIWQTMTDPLMKGFHDGVGVAQQGMRDFARNKVVQFGEDVISGALTGRGPGGPAIYEEAFKDSMAMGAFDSAMISAFG